MHPNYHGILPLEKSPHPETVSSSYAWHVGYRRHSKIKFAWLKFLTLREQKSNTRKGFWVQILNPRCEKSIDLAQLNILNLTLLFFLCLLEYVVFLRS